MRDDLLYLYERELAYLRQMGAEFAEKYPKIAGRLLLEPGKCEDPHVERLLEGFAFLAARLHMKIADEFPEIIEALFQILYPHYLRPIPSMSIGQFQLDAERGKITTGFRIERDAMLYSQPVGGVPCKFRTCYPTHLWPLFVQSAGWRSLDRLQPAIRHPRGLAAIRLQLECFRDITFSQLRIPRLRFFLHGEGNFVNTLLELLCNNCVQVVVRDLSDPEHKSVILGPGSVRHVGFAEDEAVIPYPKRSFDAYRFLQEYFAFPEKFCFIDLKGLEALPAAGFGQKIEVLFVISSFERSERRQLLELNLSEKTFVLGCTPIVNLFPQTAEPILLEQKRSDYRVIPDIRRDNSLDIFSVDDVVGISPGSPEPVRYEPFYAYRHSGRVDKRRTFWHASRKIAGWRTDRRSDVHLTLVDLSGNPMTPDEDSVTVRLTCTNADLPSRLPFGSENGDFRMETGGPISSITAIVKPTDPLQPPSQKALLWRLASQLSMNYLSLVDSGKQALQELLRLHNFSGSLYADRQVEGILKLSSHPSFGRVVSENGIAFARGTRVELELDEENFTGGGAFTFASVLERFFGLYVSMNSFSQLVVRTRQRKGVLREWAPRSGNRILM